MKSFFSRLNSSSRKLRSKSAGNFRRQHRRPRSVAAEVERLENRTMLDAAGWLGTLQLTSQSDVEYLPHLTVGGNGGDSSSADKVVSYLPETRSIYHEGGVLSPPTLGDPRAIALDYLQTYAVALGLTADVFTSAVVSDQYTSEDTGVTHLYLGQMHSGLPVANVSTSVNVSRAGEVLSVYSNFVAATAAPTTAAIQSTSVSSSLAAVQAVAGWLGITLDSLSAVSTSASTESSGDSWANGESASPAAFDYSETYLAPQLSLDAISTRAVYVPTPTGLGTGLEARRSYDR